MPTSKIKQIRKNLSSQRQRVSSCIPQRYVLTLLAFLALFNAFAMRANLSIAITNMVTKPNEVHKNASMSTTDNDNQTHSQANLCENLKPNITTDDYRLSKFSQECFKAHDHFEWSEQLQGVILSSFYWGYTLAHFPGGFFVQKYGGKYVLAFSIFFSGVLSIAIPICVQSGGANSLIALRVLMGIAQGPIIPACLNLFSSWIPATERCMIVSMAYGGITIGTIVGTLISGLLIYHFNSWQSSFYFFGVIAVIWFFFFIILCYSTPKEHPFIDDIEKSYLESEVNSVVDEDFNENNQIIPWRAMLSNGPVLALILTQLAQDWGFFVTETYLPKYLHDILDVPIQNNGILSSIPHIANFVLLFFVGIISDWLIANGHLSITNTRKLFVASTSLIAACFIIAASYSEHDETLVILCFTIAISSHSLTTSGTLVNSLDLTTHYVAPLSSCVNGIGSFIGILVPWAIGHLTPSAHLFEWRIVFWITFFVYILSIVIFSTFGSGELQPWDCLNRKTENELRVMKWLVGFFKVFMFFLLFSIFLLLITYI